MGAMSEQPEQTPSTTGDPTAEQKADPTPDRTPEPKVDPKAEQKAGQRAEKAEQKAAKKEQRDSRRDQKQSAPRKPSLSSPLRAQMFDYSDEQLAVYRSRWRAALRRVLQRGIFRAIVRSAVTPSAEVNRRVRSIRGPFVLVANHTSHVDAPLLAMSLPWTQARLLSTGVAADYWYPVWYRRLFVRWMMNAYFIDRDGSRRNAGTSRRLLRSGVPILVFPEGGRQSSGRMGTFNPGGAALAASVGVPVVPAAIVGGHEAMPKGRYWPVKGRPPVGVVFGEPLVADPDESVTDFNDRIRESVAALYASHHDRILGQSPSGGDTSTSARNR